MSMSDCIKCWDTPCTCGHDYQGRSVEWLDRQIAMLEAVVKKKRPPVDVAATLSNKELHAQTQDHRLKITVECDHPEGVREASARIIQALGLHVQGMDNLTDGRTELLLVDDIGKAYYQKLVQEADRNSMGTNRFDGLEGAARTDKLTELMTNPLLPLKEFRPDAHAILAQMAERYLNSMRVAYSFTLQENPEEPTTMGHLAWMLEQIKTDTSKSVTKRHRWLGYVQGVLLAKYDWYDLKDERDQTRRILRGM